MKSLIIAALSLFCTSVFSQDFEAISSRFCEQHNFNGTVGIASKDRVEFITSKGVANRQHGLKINADTKFKICSITKTFTAVLVLQLVERGKLDLNATIGNYLPAYAGQGRDKVTIHHLLTYSAGIPNCEGDMGLGVYQREISTDDFIKTYCSGDLEFEPGSRFNYDNGVYIILGRIIEKVTGKDFAQVLDENILSPVGLNQTGFYSDATILDGVASSYWIGDSINYFSNDPPYYIENYGAAAAMYSTVHDMLMFDNALFYGKLLQKKTLNLMLTPYPELYGVAYGFWVYDLEINGKKYRAADRQGSIWGSNATWLHLIDEGKTVVVLSNTNATDLGKLRLELLEAFLK